MTTEYSCVTVVPQLVTRLFHGYGTTVLLAIHLPFHTACQLPPEVKLFMLTTYRLVDKTGCQVNVLNDNSR